MIPCINPVIKSATDISEKTLISPPILQVVTYDPSDRALLGGTIGSRQFASDFYMDFGIEDLQRPIGLYTRIEFVNTVANNFQSCYVGLREIDRTTGSYAAPGKSSWVVQYGLRNGDAAGKPPKSYPNPGSWHLFEGYGSRPSEKITHQVMYRGYWYPYDNGRETNTDQNVRDAYVIKCDYGCYYYIPIYNGLGQLGPAKILEVVTLDAARIP